MDANMKEEANQSIEVFFSDQDDVQLTTDGINNGSADQNNTQATEGAQSQGGNGQNNAQAAEGAQAQGAPQDGQGSGQGQGQGQVPVQGAHGPPIQFAEEIHLHLEPGSHEDFIFEKLFEFMESPNQKGA